MKNLFIPNSKAVFSYCALAWLASGLAWSATVVEVLPLTDRIVMVHFSDGHVNHSSAGQPWGNETVVNAPLDTNAASSAGAWRITSTNDSNYASPQPPTQVGRKSKGTDFAWLPAPNWTLEHWLYLTLPLPMQHGKTYSINTGALASNGSDWPLTFNEATARSEAVHVNQIGYVPGAPQKYAYVFHWAGDLGGLNLSNYVGRAFHLINQRTGAADFTRTLTFHAPYNQADTGQSGQLGGTLNNNYEGADVYECDFSSFTNTGSYVVAVDGIGCSFPFSVGPDVYRQAFYKVVRGLYHNRSGIALTAPYTTWQRPAPHNPVLTPGFTNQLFYTRVRFMEWGSEGGEAKALKAGFVGFVQSAGWYQDAGDFDSYYSHLNIPATLLFTYEAAPENFKAGELNLPESTNGWPDILNEAAWLPRFCHRLRHELMDRGYCDGGIGLRIAGDAFGPDTVPASTCKGSWQDTNRLWAVSGADPWSTYFYAGVCAHLAYCLSLTGAKDPQGIDWLEEAKSAYAWAAKNTLAGDEQSSNPCPLKYPRAYAAAAIFRLTGSATCERQFQSDCPTNSFNNWCLDQGYACYPIMLYALAGGVRDVSCDPATLAWARNSLITSARNNWLSFSCSHRVCRWGGDFYAPMNVGQQTTPKVLEGMVAWAVAKKLGQTTVAANFLGNLYTTADYFLGGNAANTTWVTGLGSRHPNQVFKIDCYSLGYHDGLIPYGPWSTDSTNPGGSQNWVTDHDYANQTCYPSVGSAQSPNWPGNERWHDNRWSPMSSEFTVWQNTAPTAALFGFLCGHPGRNP